MSHYTDLDRADSINSNASSSVSSTVSSAVSPLTPSFTSSSTFNSHSQQPEDSPTTSSSKARTAFSSLNRLDEAPTLTRSTSKSFAGSIGNSVGNGVTRTDWRPSHRTRAQPGSLDSTRTGLGNIGSNRNFGSGLVPPKEEGNIWDDTRNRPTSPPLQSIGTPILRSINTTFESTSRLPSPSTFTNSPTHTNSPTYQSSTPSNRDRAISSSIFARDRINVSPSIQRARSHVRSNTLPNSGVLGMMSPIADGEQVAGLNRIRLAGESSQVAPSAVFPSRNSTHLNTTSSASPTILQSGKGLDQRRQNLVAYEYLCHLAEAKEWLLSNISSGNVEFLWDETKSFDDNLATGYALAHLARSLGGVKGRIALPSEPEVTHRGTIKDFVATANIMLFIDFVKAVGLPDIFIFETNDLYNRQNIPKVVYCIHALSHFLLRTPQNVQGVVNGMNKLSGQIEFTDDDFEAGVNGLDGLDKKRLLDFGKLGKKFGTATPIVEETRQERFERVASENLDFIINLQSTIRGNQARRPYRDQLRRQARIESERRRAEEVKRLEREDERRFQEEERIRREQERLRREEEESQFNLQREAELERERREESNRRAEIVRIRNLENQRLAEEARRFEQEERDHANRVIAVIPNYVQFQALVRGIQSRDRFSARIQLIRVVTPSVIKLQAAIRGKLVRDQFYSLKRSWRRVDVVMNQDGPSKFARGMLVWQEREMNKKEVVFYEPDVVGLQATARGFLARRAYKYKLKRLQQPKESILLQSLFRGVLARRNYWNKFDDREDMVEVVTRLQTYVRSKNQASQYRQLKRGSNVPVATIKNFVHLLDDSEFDYQDELAIERLKREVAVAIREVQGLEEEKKDADTKIALIVQNKSASELARISERTRSNRTRPDSISATGDPFSTSLDATTRRKLELYQLLFGYLQTKPEYLARLYLNAEKAQMSQQNLKIMERATFVIFGHRQETREEYLLLKLLSRSIQEELQYVPDVASFNKADSTFVRLIMKYGRGSQEKAYLKTFLGPIINKLISDQNLDLTIDLLTIHKNSVRAEERQTGRNSQRHLVDSDSVKARESACLQDRFTVQIFIQNLKNLRSQIDLILIGLFNSTREIPFGIRHLARELYESLLNRFPISSGGNLSESERSRQSEARKVEILQTVGNFIFIRFLQPAIVAPETFDISEGVIELEQRSNLVEICNFLNRLSSGKVFAENDPLHVYNDFLIDSSQRYIDWIQEVIDIPSAEAHFNINIYSDVSASRPPVIFISPNDIYSIQSLLAENLNLIIPSDSDPVRAILVELGTPPMNLNRPEEISLIPKPKIDPQDDPNAVNRLLFNSIKRKVLAILKVQHGDDFEKLIASQVTEEEEDIWDEIVATESAAENALRSIQNRGDQLLPNDLHEMSYYELKNATWTEMLELRHTGLINRKDKYQSLLDSIAADILSRGRRRSERRSDSDKTRILINDLNNKKRSLSDSIQSYQTYFESSMQSIQKKKKSAFVLPFTRQANHLRKLKELGQSFQFGSHSFDGQKLLDQKILIKLKIPVEKGFIAISSDKSGSFEIATWSAGAMMAKVEITIDQLLDYRDAGKTEFDIEGTATFDLKALQDLINRKFIR